MLSTTVVIAVADNANELSASLLNHLAVTLGMVAMALVASGLTILVTGRLHPEIRER